MVVAADQEKLDTHQVCDFGARVLSRHSHPRKENGMADTTQTSEDVLEEPVPAMQQLLDNPFLLLFIGIALPTVLYTIWGVMEIVSLPIAK